MTTDTTEQDENMYEAQDLLRWPGIRQVVEGLGRRPALPDTPFGAECAALVKQYSAKVQRLLIDKDLIGGDTMRDALLDLYYQSAAGLFFGKSTSEAQVQEALEFTAESLDTSPFGKFLIQRDVAFLNDEGERFQIEPLEYLRVREKLQDEFRKANLGVDVSDDLKQMDLHCKDTILLMAMQHASDLFDKELTYETGGKMHRASIGEFMQKLQEERDQLHCDTAEPMEHDIVQMSKTYLDSVREQLDAKSSFDAQDFGTIREKATRVAAFMTFRKNLTMPEIAAMTTHYVGLLEDSAYTAFLQTQSIPADDDGIDYYVQHKAALDAKFRAYAKKHEFDADEEIHNYEMAAKLLGLAALNSTVQAYLEQHLATPFGQKGEMVAGTLDKHVIYKKEIHALCDELKELQVTPEGTQHAQVIVEANQYLDQWIAYLKDKPVLTSEGFDDANNAMYVKGLCNIIGVKDLAQKSGAPLAGEINSRLNDCAKSPYMDFLERKHCIDDESELLFAKYETHRDAYEAEFLTSPEAEGIDPVQAIHDFKMHLRANELLTMSQKVEAMVWDRLQDKTESLKSAGRG